MQMKGFSPAIPALVLLGVFFFYPVVRMLGFAVEGDPRFDGQPEGWIVFAPGTQHVPTVTGGRMLIAYFLPGGAVEWISAGQG